MTWQVDGPQWCTPGLDVRGGRYPLAVEAPVLRMIDRLVPGVSTLTYLGRYYSLYWALAEYAERNRLDAAACKTLLRRAEVGVALTSMWDPESGTIFPANSGMHGSSTIGAVMDKGLQKLADEGAGSYSPRTWGFWSQYGGPSVTLGSVAVEKRAFRRGEVQCPEAVFELFHPLLKLCAERPVAETDLPHLPNYADFGPASADYEPLRGLLVGEPSLRDTPVGNDGTRRAAFRLIARSTQLAGSEPTSSWTAVVRKAVGYGPYLADDPVLAHEDQAQAWRGTLLRHRSVGAWRWLWSALVEQVHESVSPVPAAHLSDWIREAVDDVSLRTFLQDLPPTRVTLENLLPAESEIDARLADDGGVQWAVGMLLLGAQRSAELADDTARLAFLGGSARGANEFLSPAWVAGRRNDFADASLGDFAAALVDDMLAQSHRVALRKTSVQAGRLVMFSKLHQREGLYFATGTEGRGNVGLRTEQLGSLAHQLGLVDVQDDGVRTVTELGRAALDLPS